MHKLKLDGSRTVNEAKDLVSKNIQKGCECPVCGQGVKMYQRPINASMAYALILIHKHAGTEWVHVERLLRSIEGVPSSVRADFHKLRFWNLLDVQPGQRDDGNPHKGIYRVTELGRLFLEGTLTVMSPLRIYNNQSYGYTENAKAVNIHQALGKKFNYEKIVKA